jgi:hypothetical protein
MRRLTRLINGHVLLVGGGLLAAGGMLLVHYGRTTSAPPPYPGIVGSFRVVGHPYAGAGIAVLSVGLAITLSRTVAIMWRARLTK